MMARGILPASFWQGKRVFLTGHTGFKGSWLSLYLHRLGAVIYGFSLDPPTQPSLFAAARVGEVLAVDGRGNIRDAAGLETAMQAAQPEIVIHMAAQALVRQSYAAPVATYLDNVIGTANVLEAVRHTPGVRAVVVITTDKCYENHEWCWGYRENDALGGYDPYSSSKACAELVTAAYRQSFLAAQGAAVATVRAGNVIGGGDWAEDRLVPDCLRAIAAGQPMLVRNPAATRPWQHVLEPLTGYLLLAERLYAEGAVWAEAWNFGPPDTGILRVSELVQRLCGRLQGRYEVRPDDGPHEAGLLRLDSSKARARLGWSTQLSIDECLDSIAAWHTVWQTGEDMQQVTLAQIGSYQQRCAGAKVGRG